MTISDAAFNAWLKNESAIPVILVEAEYFGGTKYIADAYYISKGTDTPADTPYLDILAEGIQIDSKIATGSTGEISLIDDGSISDWIFEKFEGYPLRVYIGDVNWDRDDFRLRVDGICGNISAPDTDTVELQFVDRTRKLSQTIGAEDSPVAYGKVYNAQPQVVDENNWIYKVNSSAITSVEAVRNNGFLLTETTNYTVNLSTAEITLVTNSDNGTITVDFTVGANNSAADIVTAICGDIGEAVDATSLADFKANKSSAVLGVYSRTGVSAKALLDEIMISCGAEYSYNTLSELQLFRLEPPDPGDIAVALTLHDVNEDEGGLTLVATEPPVTEIVMGYKKNWTPQTEDQTVTSLSVAEKDALAKDYQVVSYVNSLTGYPLATSERINTNFDIAAEAHTECTRRALIRSQKRYTFELQCLISAVDAKIGDTISFEYNQYGFDPGSGGGVGRVIGINRFIGSKELELTLWL